MACHLVLLPYIVVMKRTHSQLWASLTPHQRKDRADAVARWRRAHPEHLRQAAMYRRLNRCPQFILSWPLIVQHYGGHCLLCARPAHADHVIPLRPDSDASLNQLTNLQPLCRACNTIKGHMQTQNDYRPDKGAWIAELVRLNPTLYIDHSVQRGGRHRDVPRTLILPTATFCHP